MVGRLELILSVVVERFSFSTDAIRILNSYTSYLANKNYMPIAPVRWTAGTRDTSTTVVSDDTSASAIHDQSARNNERLWVVRLR